MGFWESVKAFRLSLWDEARQEMVSFRAAREVKQQAQDTRVPGSS